MPHIRRRSRMVTLVLLMANLLTGCVAWQVDPTPLPQRLEQRPPSDLRIWLRSGVRYDLTGPTIRSDTLYGYTHGMDQLNVPMSELARYATRTVHRGRILTVVMVVGLVGVVAWGIDQLPEPCAGSGSSC